MKYYLNEIVVVEGKEDSCFLSSFIEAEYVITNGYEIPDEEINYLNEASKHKNIIVLVDPDKAGRMIESELKQKLLKATFLNVEIYKCSRGKKDGIAECEIEEIINVLKPYLKTEKYKNNGVLQGKSLKIELSNKELRSYLSKKYHLGKCNNKTLLKRLNTLEISEEELVKKIEDYNNGN